MDFGEKYYCLNKTEKNKVINAIITLQRKYRNSLKPIVRYKTRYITTFKNDIEALEKLKLFFSS